MREVNIHYSLPIHYDGLIKIKTKIIRVMRYSIQFEMEILNSDNKKCVFSRYRMIPVNFIQKQTIAIPQEIIDKIRLGHIKKDK